MPDNTNQNSNVAIIVGGALLIIILAGIFILTWHKSLTGTQALEVATIVLGIAGGLVGVHVGGNAAAKAVQTHTDAVIQSKSAPTSVVLTSRSDTPIAQAVSENK